MVCSVAGITSDANVLTNELRVIGKFISQTSIHFNPKKMFVLNFMYIFSSTLSTQLW